MVSDSGQVSDVTEFQDDQGINIDDEEAVAVEKGEFSVQPAKARIPFKSVKPGMAAKAPAPAPAPAKRAASAVSTASDQDEGGGKKKKAKKA
jgi:hypothetical protein